MTLLPDLSRLTDSEKDALNRDLLAELQERDAVVAALSKRLAELKAKLGDPPKGPDNSSVPPSQGRKSNKACGESGGKKRRRGHGRGGRKLAKEPDNRVDAKATRCPHCRGYKSVDSRATCKTPNKKTGQATMRSTGTPVRIIIAHAVEFANQSCVSGRSK